MSRRTPPRQIAARGSSFSARPAAQRRRSSICSRAGGSPDRRATERARRWPTIGYGDENMPTDALALSPFTDRIAYRRKTTRSCPTLKVSFERKQRQVSAASAEARPAICSRKGQLPAPAARRSTNSKVVGLPLPVHRHGGAKLKPFAWPPIRRARVYSIVGAFSHLYYRARRQILDRTERDAAGRDRRRLGIPLSQGDYVADEFDIVVSQSDETADTLASLP